MTSLAMVH